MKLSKLFLSAALLMSTLTVSAKHQRFTPDTYSSFNRIYGAFTWGKLRYEDEIAKKFEADYGMPSMRPFGGTIGYTRAINMAKGYPIFFEVGGELNIQHRRIVNIEETSRMVAAQNGGARISETQKRENHITGDYMSVAIPLNVTYLASFAGGRAAIAPFIGLNLKFNISGKEQYSKMTYTMRDDYDKPAVNGPTAWEYNCFDRSKDTEDNPDYNCNRFLIGMNIGMNVYIHQFMFGYRFQPDFTHYKYVKSSLNPNITARIMSSCHYFTVGYCF